MPDLPAEGIRDLADEDFRSRALLIANRPSDLRAGDPRVESFVRFLRNDGKQSYLVPLVADLGLSSRESHEFVAELDRRFPAFVAMGGEDIDVSLWGQELYPESLINTERDRFERALIAQKLATLKFEGDNIFSIHRLLGVCRGAQFIAREMGYAIGTHIPNDFHASHVNHGKSYVPEAGAGEPTHRLKILETTKSVIKKLIGDESEITVNSYHHQYISWREGGQLHLAGVSEDGVPEAFESADGRIVLMQFHPELMAIRSQGDVGHLGEKILSGILAFLFPEGLGDCAEALVR